MAGEHYLSIDGGTGSVRAARVDGGTAPARAAVFGEFFTRPIDEDFGKRPMPYGIALCLGGLYTAFTIVSLG